MRGLRSENNIETKNPGLLLLVLLCYCKTEEDASVRFVFYNALPSVREWMLIDRLETVNITPVCHCLWKLFTATKLDRLSGS